MFLVVFDRLGRLLSVFPSGFRARVIFDLYSWTFLSAFYLGWLAAPLTHLLLGFGVCVLEGRQSWPGGLVSLARWLGLLLGVGLRFS